MESELIEMIFLSEKRKQLLLFLADGSKNMDEIIEALQAPSTAILPQIKKLKEKSLVIQQDKNYALSLIGRILVNKMKPLVNIIDVFEDNFDYWTERDLQGIPFPFKKWLEELEKCRLIQPDLDRMFELDPEILGNLRKSETILECLAYFHPSLISLCQKLAKNGIKISFLMSEQVFKRYSKDCIEGFKGMLNLKNTSLFLYSGELRIANLTVTDKSFMISFFPKDQKHFDMESLVSYELSAIHFGEDLFCELLRSSTRITHISDS